MFGMAPPIVPNPLGLVCGQAWPGLDAPGGPQLTALDMFGLHPPHPCPGNPKLSCLGSVNPLARAALPEPGAPIAEIPELMSQFTESGISESSSSALLPSCVAKWSTSASGDLLFRLCLSGVVLAGRPMGPGRAMGAGVDS